MITEKILKIKIFFPNLPLSKKKEEKNTMFNGPTVIFSKVKAPNLFLHLERAFFKGAPWWQVKKQKCLTKQWDR